MISTFFSDWHSTTQQSGSSVNAWELYSGCTPSKFHGWQRRMHKNSQYINSCRIQAIIYKIYVRYLNATLIWSETKPLL